LHHVWYQLEDGWWQVSKGNQGSLWIPPLEPSLWPLLMGVPRDYIHRRWIFPSKIDSIPVFFQK
jgi:hypothetical protein